MDIRFQAHNTHLENAQEFATLDFNLRRLYAEPYVFKSKLLSELPTETPGIYTLGGGRQIGKTTLLKQWMERLLQKNIPPECLFFFSGELIDDHHALYRLIKDQLSRMPSNALKFLLVDEVTYIQEWDRAVKFLADTGELEKVILLLTGSDLVLMEDARQRFPGRRGASDVVDFHYYPLSFKEFVDLKTKQFVKPEDCIPYLQNYLIHGGFMTAINDFEKNQKISTATLTTYSDWIRGDVQKRNKQEHYLREIISGTIKHYGSQISWDNFVQELSINHVATVADYINLLSSMDACFIQHALLEDKLVAAPKKRKKVIFNDPFIYHAMRAWLEPSTQAYEEQIIPFLLDPKKESQLIESTVASHFRRYAPTYYIKAEGEVDIAYIHHKKFWPIEIKWRNQQRPSDLKQISKYPHGVIYAKVTQLSEVNHIPIIPLAEALYDIEALFR
jgi:uncharacterized protein